MPVFSNRKTAGLGLSSETVAESTHPFVSVDAPIIMRC